MLSHSAELRRQTLRPLGAEFENSAQDHRLHVTLTVLLDRELEGRIVIGGLLDLERAESTFGRVASSAGVDVVVYVEHIGRAALLDEWRIRAISEEDGFDHLGD